MKPGLDRMEAALERMENLDCPVVQIVGTNGKGSTGCFLESLAEQHGLRTGLYTSPHFLTVRERIRVNSGPVDPGGWVAAANELMDLCPDIDFSYFEFLTLLAFCMFRREGVELAVFEAGLGGSFDATTALRRDMLLFTRIGLDHQEVLGKTLEAVTLDKAGAMRQDIHVLTGTQEPYVSDLLFHCAKRRNLESFATSESRLSGEDIQLIHETPLSLPGAHQKENAALALAGWAVLARKTGRTMEPEPVCRALSRAWLPGRLQRVKSRPEILLDGAHNVQGLEALHFHLKEKMLKPEAVIFHCLSDKDVKGMVKAVESMHPSEILIPKLSVPGRGMDPSRLAKMFFPAAQGMDSMQEAVRYVSKKSGLVVLCGSLYLLADYFALFPHHLHGGEEGANQADKLSVPAVMGRTKRHGAKKEKEQPSG